MNSLIHLLHASLGFNPYVWIRDTRRMRNLVAEFKVQNSAKHDANHFACVVAPWTGTAVPWFSLVCGLFLASNGSRVTLIIDNLPFGTHGIRFRFVLSCIYSVLRLLKSRYDIIYLSDHCSRQPLDLSACKMIDKLAELNAVWALRGETKEIGRQHYMMRAVRQLSLSYGAICSVLKDNPYEAIFVAGGIWGSSGVWVERARAAEVRVASFDSGGPGTLMLATDGIAAQLQDIPRAFSLLKSQIASKGEYAFIAELALAEIEKRRSGKDKFSSQLIDSEKVIGRYDGAVLIALNSSWDTAALGLHAIFKSSTEWLVETVRFLLECTEVPAVIVRQHPAERFAGSRSNDNYGSLLNHHFGLHPRLHFIAADVPVNSYDLLEQVAAVVVYTSTIGTEAAANGKVVITESNSYYSSLGFVWKATGLAEYKYHLQEAMSGRYEVTKAMREDALYCYYLTQCCNWVSTPFSPENYGEWSRYDLAQLSQHDKVQMTIKALEQNIPIAYLNHLARVAQLSISP